MKTQNTDWIFLFKHWFSLYAFFYYYFSKKDLPLLFTKCILILIAVTGIFITSSLMRGFMWFDIALSYSISSILTGLFFKLNFKSKEENVK